MNFRFKIIFLLFPLITLSWSQDCCETADLATDNCGGLGCYIPQCTENCNWEPMQCWSSTGYCWCVDENGEEIEGTSMPSWQGYPDCEEYIEDCTDGDIIDDDPCFISECFDGQWNDLIIDCAEDFGVPCEGGIYIPALEGECCSECALYGDINLDGVINVLDIIEVIGLIMENQYSQIGDYNTDGYLNVVDIVSIVSLILNSGNSTIPEECLLEPDPGPCFGYMPMYYFNQDTQSCEMFIYGGCMGLIPFESLEECQDLCE